MRTFPGPPLAAIALAILIGALAPAGLGNSARASEIVSGGYSLELLAYEGFDYATGPLVPANGGTGWTAPWSKSYGPGGDFQVIGAGLTYPGLDVTGGAIEWGFGGNQINGARRTLERVHDGIVYVQALSHYTSQTGFGTPNLRFNDDSTGAYVQTFAIGGNGAPDMAILDPVFLQPLASSNVSMNQLLLTIVQIDYAANHTSLWVNPDLSTFDYASPPVADAVASDFAPTFSAIDPLTRSGARLDELRVLRLVAPPPAPLPAPTPAEPPSDIDASAGDGSATVTWSPPKTSGSYPVTHYLVMSFPGGRICLTTDLQCTVRGLTNGVAYTFTAQALTGAGWSPKSAASKEVVPWAPVDPTITISGLREGKRIHISGETTGLPEGTVLRPWLRPQGQPSFSRGRARIVVDDDGNVEWSRRTARAMAIYLTAEDSTTQSNRLRIR